MSVSTAPPDDSNDNGIDAPEPDAPLWTAFDIDYTDDPEWSAFDPDRDVPDDDTDGGGKASLPSIEDDDLYRDTDVGEVERAFNLHYQSSAATGLNVDGMEPSRRNERLRVPRPEFNWNKVKHNEKIRRYSNGEPDPDNIKWATSYYDRGAKYRYLDRINRGTQDRDQETQISDPEKKDYVRRFASQLELGSEVVDIAAEALSGVNLNDAKVNDYSWAAIATLALVHDTLFEEQWRGRRNIPLLSQDTEMEEAAPLSETNPFCNLLAEMDMTIYNVRKTQKNLMEMAEFTFEGECSNVTALHDKIVKERATG